ncbi:hypothetical protein A2U01_0119094, partial [Trifolium medium]|nr:hypothetical protein [Trifolium medium]
LSLSDDSVSLSDDRINMKNTPALQGSLSELTLMWVLCLRV